MVKHLLFLLLVGCAALPAKAQLSAVVSSANPTCAGNNGSATVSASGGSGYTYKWSTGVTTATANGLAAGTYTVTVYSGGGTVWDTLYLETFDAAPAWTLNTSTGANGADPNFWTISDNEGGVAPGGCGAGSNGDATLHVTSVFNPNGGAAYDAGGLCGVLFCPLTNAAAESGNIATTGATNLVLTYDFIGGGQGLTDNASSLYSVNGGTAFTSLDASLKSTNTGCGGQGRWLSRGYNLPVACNGLTDFRLRFNWTNNDDGVGTDPSFALNNVLLRDSLPAAPDSIVKTVTLTQPVGPYFVTAALSIIQPACGQQNGSINNVGIAGGTPAYTLAWSISGAQIGSGNSLTNIGAGTYQLQVTDANGCSIDTSFTLVNGGSGAAVITTNKPAFCANDSTDVCVTGNYTTYLWNTGATTNCITVKQAGNYYVTVTDGGGCTAESNRLAITVNPLPPVSISVSGDTLKAYGAVSYQWYVNGNLIANATDSVYIAAQGGLYTVQVSNSYGCYATSNGITITAVNTVLPGSIALRIQPNPATNYAQVLVHETLIGEELQLIDLTGRILLKQKINTGVVPINLTELTAGLYFVTCRNAVVKLMKQ